MGKPAKKQQGKRPSLKAKAPSQQPAPKGTGPAGRSLLGAKKPDWQSPFKNIKKEKATIIVLVAAAVIFVAALVSIYGEDFMQGKGEIFWAYGDELVEFEKATVNEILTEDLEADEVANGAYSGNQLLSVTVKSGRYKGETMEVYNYVGPLSGVPVSVHDGVTLTIKTHSDGSHSATVYEFNRIPILAVLLIIFFLIVIVVGRLTGLKSLVGLVFTCVCLFLILIPRILKGAPTVFTTFVVCVYIALVAFTILGGVHRKTISA